MKRIGFRKINFSLGFRLSMGFTLILTLLLGVMGTTIYLRDREAFIEEFKSRGWGIAKAVNGYAYQTIKTQDSKLLSGIVNSLVNEKYVMQAALLEKDGKVLASAGLKAPIPSNIKLSAQGWSKIMKDEKGNVKAVVFLSPVTAEDGTVGGYLYLLCNFSPIAEYLQETMHYIIINYAAVCLIGLLMVRRVIRNFVEKPVKALMVATERVSIGDFSQKLQIINNDELGRLACAFNAMMDQLGLLFGNIKNITKDMIHNSDLISQRSAYVERYDSSDPDAGKKSELMREIATAARRIARIGNQLDSLVQQFKTTS
ncbi:HAMP domain-containing protein [Caldanaerovirga acetigignens]|uniref:histidine kinase n=1 Tax=Caldanaerovirga acetigignens TaxID=447595 RepID=A0A1M7IPK0_9FIRM|nr:HAMP domain-containing protein [Caldanaerovirga acetigignens]SHM42508.1 HAMP domain-containing protein [Caldanaerovirga acetigignens]